MDLTEEEAGAAEGADMGGVRSDSDEDSGGDEYVYVEEVAGEEENLSEFYLAKARRFAKYNKPKKMQGLLIFKLIYSIHLLLPLFTKPVTAPASNLNLDPRPCGLSRAWRPI